MLAVVIAVQLLEGNVLQPWIQGRAVRLHPLVIACCRSRPAVPSPGSSGVFLVVPITAAGRRDPVRAAGGRRHRRPARLLRPPALQRRRRLSPVTRSGSWAARAARPVARPVPVVPLAAAGTPGPPRSAGSPAPAQRPPGPRRSRARRRGAARSANATCTRAQASRRPGGTAALLLLQAQPVRQPAQQRIDEQRHDEVHERPEQQ